MKRFYTTLVTLMAVITSGYAELELPDGEDFSIGDIIWPGFYVNMAAGGSSEEPGDLAVGHHDPNRDGFTLQGLEASASLRANDHIQGFAAFNLSWGTDEEEKKRKNTLLSNDVAKEMKVAQEWLDALGRTDTTGQRLFGSKELGEIEIERKPSKAITIKGKFWAGQITHGSDVFLWGSITNPYFSDVEKSKTHIHLTNGTFKMMEPLENAFNVENGAKISVDHGDIICGHVNGIRDRIPDPDARVGMSIERQHFSELVAPNGKIIAGDVHETVLLDATDVAVLNLVDNVKVKGNKIQIFGSKVSYDVYIELRKGGSIRFFDRGSAFDISDDAILKLENGKEFLLDE